MTITTIYTVKDSYITPQNPNSNYGGFNYIYIGMEGAFSQRGLIEFDLSSISGSILNTVTLNVRGVGSPINIYAQRITNNSWTEMGVTWNTQPTTTTTNQVLFTNTNSGWYTINITNLVKDGFVIGNIVGILFLKQYEGGSTYDNSGLFSRNTGAAYLTIDYSSPANITMQNITVGGIPCMSGCNIICTTNCPAIVDIVVTWANSGGSSGTFTPTITIGGGTPIPAGTQITIAPGLTGTTTFSGVSLPEGTQNVCINTGTII